MASKCYEVPPPTEMANDAAVNNALMQADAVRMIGIRKKAGEPLVRHTHTHTHTLLMFVYCVFRLVQRVT